jgi:two-component system, chemotaxis family, protein-glutamate methylesterase/glutaminase
MPVGKRILQPGSRIRVLVVDDSVVIRRLVTHALGEEPRIEVVGAASDGAIALAKIPQVNPDVVTLDIEMPTMDGLETLRRIRQEYPELYVIMFSTLTQRGATATMDALTLGANDYVTKAANAGSLDRSMASLRAELVPKILQFFHFHDEPRPAPRAPDPPRAPCASPGPVAASRHLVTQRRQVVAIGVSTGGPTALSTVLPQFPKDFPLPVLTVQHMPPIFTKLLADRLNGQCALQVEEAEAGTRVAPGKVLIARGDYHMRVRRNGAQVEVALDQSSPENSCRPAVDTLFRSVQEIYGGGAIAVILTGMGQDGFRGAEVLKANGAYVVAQDEATSVVWGMPGLVVKAGLADAVVPLDRVADEIMKHI